MLKIKRAAIAAASSLVLAVPLAGAAVVPAQAAVSTQICYSSDSTDHHSLEAYQIGGGAWNVPYGSCSPVLNNSSDQVRVDVCWDNQTISYYQIKSDSGYGPKHYGCNSSSNPPNYSGKVYYKLMN